MNDIAQAEQLFNEGKRHFSTGNWPGAVSSLSRCLTLAEAVPDAHFMLGTALFQTGQVDKAIGHLKRCVELKPGHPEAHTNLGVILGQNDRIPEAEVHLARGASLGNPQAKAMLKATGVDYCRKCVAPVQVGKSRGGAGAMVTFIDPSIGLRCESCGEIFCQECVPGLQSMSARCPKCQGDMAPLV